MEEQKKTAGSSAGRPWEKYRRPEDTEEISPAQENSSPENKQKKKIKKKGDGDYYKELGDYLNKEYDRVLGPMRAVLAGEGYYAPDGSLIRYGSAEDTTEKNPPHSPETKLEKEDKSLLSDKMASSNEIQKDAETENTFFTEDNKSPSHEMPADTMASSHETSSDIMSPSHDLRKNKMSPESSLHGDKMSPSNSSISDKKAPDTSSLGDIPSPDFTPFIQKKPRVYTPLNLSGYICKDLLNKRIDKYKTAQMLTLSYALILRKLVEIADKEGNRRILVAMNTVCSECNVTNRTGRRFTVAAQSWPDIFEGFSTNPGVGTSILFCKDLWKKKSDDRLIDKDKVFSFFPENLHPEDRLYMEYLFILHLSGFKIFPSFTTERENFLRGIVKKTKGKFLEKFPYESEIKNAENIYREAAAYMVSMWLVVKKGAGRKIIENPFAYFLKSWKANEGDELPGDNISKRKTEQDETDARKFIEQITYVLKDQLYFPDMPTLWAIGEIFFKRDCSSMSREALKEMIMPEALKIAGEIIKSCEYVDRKRIIPKFK